MRWLANENVPLASIRRLRGAGYDVAAIVEDAPGSADPDVLARAVSEGRIVLTFDRDYGELIYHRRLLAPPGVVYLRFAPVTPDEAADQVLSLLAIPNISLDGKFTTVERGHVRQRDLP